MLDINISIYIHIYMECSDASSAIVCLRVRCMCCLLVHASKTDTQASINVVSSSNGCHDNVHHFEHPRSVFVQDIPLCITAEVYIRHILRRDVHSLADIRFRPEYTPLYISMHTLSIINIIIIIVFFFFFLVAVVAFCTVCVSGTDSHFKYMCNLKCNASILRYINIFFLSISLRITHQTKLAENRGGRSRECHRPSMIPVHITVHIRFGIYYACICIYIFGVLLHSDLKQKCSENVGLLIFEDVP